MAGFMPEPAVYSIPGFALHGREDVCDAFLTGAVRALSCSLYAASFPWEGLAPISVIMGRECSAL